MLSKSVLAILSLFLIIVGILDILYGGLTRISIANGWLLYGIKFCFDFVLIGLGMYSLRKTIALTGQAAGKRILIILPLLGGIIGGYYYMFYSPFNEEKQQIKKTYAHLRSITENQNKFFNKYKNFPEEKKKGIVQYYVEMRAYQHEINNALLDLEDAAYNAYHDFSFEAYQLLYCTIVEKAERTETLDSYVFGVSNVQEPALKTEDELDSEQYHLFSLLDKNFLRENLVFVDVNHEKLVKKIQCSPKSIS